MPTDEMTRSPLRGSPVLVVAVRPFGMAVPRYDGADEVPLDVAGLGLVDALASADGLAPTTVTDGSRRAVLDALVARGLVDDGTDSSSAVARRLADPLADAGDGPEPAEVTGELVMPTPVLFGVGP